MMGRSMMNEWMDEWCDRWQCQQRGTFQSINRNISFRSSQSSGNSQLSEVSTAIITTWAINPHNLIRVRPASKFKLSNDQLFHNDESITALNSSPVSSDTRSKNNAYISLPWLMTLVWLAFDSRQVSRWPSTTSWKVIQEGRTTCQEARRIWWVKSRFAHGKVKLKTNFAISKFCTDDSCLRGNKRCWGGVSSQVVVAGVEIPSNRKNWNEYNYLQICRSGI